MIVTAAAAEASVSNGSVKDPAAEANHRIANNLSLLVSMVRLQAGAAARRTDPVSPADLRHALEGIAARVSTIGQLHRMLAHTPNEGATRLMPHLRDVGETLMSALSSPERSVRMIQTGGDCIVQVHQIQPIVLILCEAFINAMKYAHPAGAPLVFGVDCAVTGEGREVITINDDGVGLPEGFDVRNGGGLGFRVIRSLAGELGASLDIHSSPLGLCLRLTLPASAQPGGKLS